MNKIKVLLNFFIITFFQLTTTSFSQSERVTGFLYENPASCVTGKWSKQNKFYMVFKGENVCAGAVDVFAYYEDPFDGKIRTSRTFCPKQAPCKGRMGIKSYNNIRGGCFEYQSYKHQKDTKSEICERK